MAKQRLEVRTTPAPAAPGLLGAAPAGTAVIDTKPGDITWVDRAKAYWHTIIASIGGLALVVLEVAPDISSGLDAFPHSPTWDSARHWLSLAVVIATVVVTKVKPNEVWAPAPGVVPGE